MARVLISYLMSYCVFLPTQSQLYPPARSDYEHDGPLPAVTQLLPQQ